MSNESLKKIPKFKYHPNPFETGVFHDDKSVVCDCCGETVDIYYPGKIYCIADVEYLCPECIASGKAAEKYDGVLVQGAEENCVSDPKKINELFKRTPGYISWQGEYWLTCCDDFCAYLGDIGTKELEEMGIANEVFAEYDQRCEYENVRECLEKAGFLAGYLFRCLHCNKYHLWVDAE